MGFLKMGNTYSTSQLRYNGALLPLEKPIAVFEDTLQFFTDWISAETHLTVYTSGSTGQPKPIQLAKSAMLASAQQTVDFLQLQESNQFLLCLPVEFIAGKMMVVRAMVAGANLIQVKPTANPLLNVKEPVHFAAFTPYQVAEIIKNDDTKAQFESIDQVIIGGGEIPQQLEQKLNSFKNTIYASYGMTETITHIALRKLGDPNKIYKAFKGIQLSNDPRGCLTIQASYLGNELIVTNDLVEFEGPREFKFLGRIDNVINSGGIKLQAELIEQKLRELITLPFFIGKQPDEQLGEKVVLVIQSTPFDSTTLKLLHNSIKDVLNKYEIPKEVLFTPLLERTPTGKINRKATLAKLNRL